MTSRAFRFLLVAAGMALVADVALRRRMLDWGSTRAEATRALPGDELLPDADLVATRAITIDAPPDAVWPWLVQLGTGRAGAYSYDLLDRLAGLDMHSSWRIHPELQDLSVDDVIPVDPSDGTSLRVHTLESEHVLATRTDDGTWAWTWVLEPLDGGTRLLARTRMTTAHQSLLGWLATNLLMVPASWVMEQKMLRGLRERAESW